MSDTLQINSWTFGPMVWGKRNRPGTLIVHRGTGHWSHTLTEDNQIGEQMVYNWEATWTSDDGLERINTVIDRRNLRYLRTLPIADTMKEGAS